MRFLVSWEGVLFKRGANVYERSPNFAPCVNPANNVRKGPWENSVALPEHELGVC